MSCGFYISVGEVLSLVEYDEKYKDRLDMIIYLPQPSIYCNYLTSHC
jgi:hypothetical protein